MEKLGLDITKPGDPVPKSGDVPRFFLFREGKVSSLEESQISVGSREFWRAAVMGQVFAYPAGEKHPVQLQLSDYNGFSPRLQFSDPLDPEKPPAAKMYKEPPRPKWYHRWFPFGSNRRLCEAYDRFKAAEAKQPELTQQCVKTIKEAYGDKRDPETLSKEADEALLAQTLFVQRKLNKEVQSNLDSRRMELEMVPKPDALDHVVNPKMMEELDEMLDRLIQKDGLDKADVNELSNKLGMHQQRGNDYTKDTLMDKLIEANQQPQQQEAGQPDVPNVQKAQEGPAEEKQEEQQIIQ